LDTLTVLILPGFEDGSNASYVRRFMADCTKRGIRTVTLNFRGYAGQQITVSYGGYNLIE
jgi:predicted alpha/beta-fold hydrolase